VSTQQRAAGEDVDAASECAVGLRRLDCRRLRIMTVDPPGMYLLLLLLLLLFIVWWCCFCRSNIVI
jgi:hypothetical protein